MLRARPGHGYADGRLFSGAEVKDKQKEKKKKKDIIRYDSSQDGTRLLGPRERLDVRVERRVDREPTCLLRGVAACAIN